MAKTKITGFFSRINFEVFRVINKREYDYVLIHGYQTLTCWFVLLAAKIKGVKTILRGEAIIKKENLTIVKFIKRLFISIYLKNVDAIYIHVRVTINIGKLFL